MFWSTAKRPEHVFLLCEILWGGCTVHKTFRAYEIFSEKFLRKHEFSFFFSQFQSNSIHTGMK